MQVRFLCLDYYIETNSNYVFYKYPYCMQKRKKIFKYIKNH